MSLLAKNEANTEVYNTAPLISEDRYKNVWWHIYK